MYDDSDDDNPYSVEKDRLTEISVMTRADKLKVVPFLGALGFWVTIFDDNDCSCPFTLNFHLTNSMPPDALAPLAPGAYELTLPIPHNV